MSPPFAPPSPPVAADGAATIAPTNDAPVTVADVVAFQPRHAVPEQPGARVERLRGRPRRAERAPDFSEVEYQDHVNRLCERWVEQDVLVRTLTGDRRDPMAIVRIAMVQLAEESAALRFDAQETAARGRDVAMLRSRRIDALAKLASLILSGRKLGHQELSEGTVERIRDLFFDLVFDALAETLPAKSAERARAALNERMPSAERILGVTDPRAGYPIPER